MLVLTRKLQQQIKIGEEITITILRVKGNTVRVGVQAPRDVRVIRGELPKNDDEAVVEETTVSHEACEITVINAEVEEHADAPADESALPALRPIPVPPLPLPSPTAAHLPLRRLRDRHGIAPLKQVIASCGVLAK